MNNANLVFTPAVQQAQVERGSAKAYAGRVEEGFPDTVTPELAAFIAEQDTAFLGTTNAQGAPYIQHRGGPKASSRSSTNTRSVSPTIAAIGNTSRSPT